MSDSPFEQTEPDVTDVTNETTSDNEPIADLGTVDDSPAPGDVGHPETGWPAHEDRPENQAENQSETESDDSSDS